MKFYRQTKVFITCCIPRRARLVLIMTLAKKQEAFEASIRLSNQFQPLSESDVDFLDSVVEAKKQEEAEKKRVEAEELDKFRRNRQETEVGKDLVGEAVEGGWRKRKRGLKKKSLAGLSKKIDGDDEKKEIDDAGENMENGDDRQKRVKADKEKKSNEEGKKTLATEPAKAIPQPAHKPAGGLGLVEYGSDDDTD